MKKSLTAVLASASLLISANSIASDREVSVEITNLTNAIYFTPLLVAAHKRDTHLFQLSTEASDNLQAMAEGGNIDGLILDLEAAGSDYVANPAGGLLEPGKSAEAVLDRQMKKNRYLSIVGMMLPTNDGFVGIDGLRIPHKKGTYTYYLHGYD
ncbi:MAG: spondin domain-containing protein, partial [Candidatus Thiodiazotropha sp. (ex Lucinoma borealis)]|nr:spondin domain-containing protein [Candidatus Thiodiazotropha sp. (ex Lucinoma borealis)]